MKVIDDGPDPSAVKRVVCSNCGATLEYVRRDVQLYQKHCYDGSISNYEYVICPKCNYEQTVRVT